MPGEKNLDILLSTMEPTLNEGRYVFCTLQPDTPVDQSLAIMTFREQEGMTVILEQSVADRLQLPYTFVASWITLTVHSSLDAVGLTAAFSQALAREQISCNVVAGYFHDHLFVDAKDGQKAMEALNRFRGLA